MKIALTVLSIVILLVVALYALAFKTEQGRTFILSIALPLGGEALNSTLTVGGTGGNWPETIILTDVSARDDIGEWFRADRLELSWRPVHSLLAGWNIRRLAVQNPRLNRLPDLPETKPEVGDDLFAVPHLPRSLPRVRVSEALLSGLHLGPALVAKKTMINAHGSLTAGGDKFSLSLSAHTDSLERESLSMQISWHQRRDRLEIALDAGATENGVLGSLLREISGKPAPFAVKLEGSGPATNWAGKLAVDWPSGFDLDADFLCTCRTSLSLAARVSAVLPPNAPADWRTVLGEEPELSLRLHARPQEGWQIELQTLSTPIASVADPVVLSLRPERGGNRGKVSGSLELGAPLKRDLPSWLGTHIRIAADIPLKKSGQPRNGYLQLGMGPATVELAEILAMGDHISAIGTLTLSPEEKMPSALLTALGTGGSLRGEISRTGKNAYTVRNGTITMVGGLDGQVDAAYDPAGQHLVIDLTASLKSVLIQKLVPQLKIDAPVLLTASTRGPFPTLKAEVGLNVPPTSLSEHTLPAARLRLQAALQDALIDGAVGLDLEAPLGQAGERHAQKMIADAVTARFANSEAEGFVVKDLNITYPRIEGTGSAHIKGEKINANLAMNIADLSILDPDATGDLAFDAVFQQAQGRSSISAKANSEQIQYKGARAEKINLSVNGPFDALGVEMQSARIGVTLTDPIRRFSTSLNLVEKGKETSLHIKELTGQWRGDDITLRAPAKVSVAELSTQIENLAFDWGEQGSLSAVLSLTPERIEAKADLTQIPVPDLPILVSGALDLDTSKDKPGHLKLSLLPSREGEIDAGAVIEGIWDGKTINLSAALETPGNTAERQEKSENLFSLALPLRTEKAADHFSFVLGNEVNGAIAYKSRLENLTTLFLSDDHQVKGNLELAGVIFGATEKPEVSLTVDISDTVYEQIAAGMSLTDLNAHLKGSGTLHGVSGTLSLEASDRTPTKNDTYPVVGNATFAFSPESGMTTRAELALRRASLISRDDIDITLSGDVSLVQEQRAAAKLTGELVIDKADILIPESSLAAEVVDVNVITVRKTKGDGIEEIRMGSDRPKTDLSPALEITIRSDEQLFVRGRGLETEWQGELKVSGTIAAPRIAGVLQLRKGTLSFAGRQFDITQGQISFLGSTPEEAVLNIEAEYMTDDSTKAMIGIRQNAVSPAVTLASVPSLPQETIMSLVLFGKPATELSAFEALQVTQALAALSGTTPFGTGRGIADRIRAGLGLDLLKLNINQDESSGTAASLSVGKYVRKGVFVSATQDTAGLSGTVSVRIDIAKSFSIATDIAQGGDNTLTLQWRRDY